MTIPNNRTANLIAQIIANTQAQEASRFTDQGKCTGNKYVDYEDALLEALDRVPVRVPKESFLEHQINATPSGKVDAAERGRMMAEIIRMEKDGPLVLNYGDANFAFGSSTASPTSLTGFDKFKQEIDYETRVYDLSVLEEKIRTKVWQGEGVEQEREALVKVLYNPNHPLNIAADEDAAREFAEAFERTAAAMKEDALGHPQKKTEYDTHMREELAQMELRVSDRVFVEYQANALQDAMKAGNAEGFYREQARRLTVQGKAMLDYQEACNAVDRIIANDPRELEDAERGVPPRADRLLNAENNLLSAVWDKDDPKTEKAALVKLLFDPLEPVNVAADITTAKLFVDALATLATRTRDELLGIRAQQKGR